LFAIVIAVLAAAPAVAGTVHIAMKDVAFSPAKIAAKVGDTVEWANKDFVAHTATARDGSFNVDLAASKTGRTVLKKAGKVEYYCRYHPTMKAEIDVSK